MSRDPADATTFGRIGDVAGAVLTGGASSRMGRDKAALSIGGVAAATRVARVLAACFEEVLLVGGSPPADAPGRRVADGAGPRCALRGLVAALEATDAPRVFVAATDLPFVTPALVLGLVAWPEADAVLPVPPEGRQPLCAVYRRATALAEARRALAEGRLALSAWLARLGVERVEGEALAHLDPDGRALANLNTPEDLARAEVLLEGPPRT